MSHGLALLVLFICACLEAGGDALVRHGMHSGAGSTRAVLYLSAAVVLFAYGWLVNRPPWSFGSLLGVYIVLFFVVAQALSWVVFGERPGAHILIGGALIVTGGLLIAVRA